MDVGGHSRLDREMVNTRRHKGEWRKGQRRRLATSANEVYV